MTVPAPRPTRLAEYTPYPFTVTEVALTFRLAPGATRVLARIALPRTPRRPGRHDLRLDGEGLRLISVRDRRQAGAPEDYR